MTIRVPVPPAHDVPLVPARQGAGHFIVPSYKAVFLSESSFLTLDLYRSCGCESISRLQTIWRLPMLQ